jgi:hypothetical protein
LAETDAVTVAVAIEHHRFRCDSWTHCGLHGDDGQPKPHYRERGNDERTNTHDV